MTSSEAKAALGRLPKPGTTARWQFDGDNTIYTHDAPIKYVASIYDHPQDGEFAPEQIAERSAWYKESADNAWFMVAAQKLMPALLAYAIATWDTAGKHTAPCLATYISRRDPELECTCNQKARKQAQADVARALEGI